VITAVDSNVFLDVFVRDPSFVDGSKAALRDARALGGLVACDVVWAELAAWFPDEKAQADALRVLGVAFSSSGQSAAHAAGRAWRSYRSAGGARTRMVGDFLVGAHAQVHAGRLLTRDRGFFRNHFEDLEVIEPA
jgi:predicted nucleic acid-binding protein